METCAPPLLISRTAPDHVGRFGRVDRGHRADLLREIQLVIGPVDRDHIGAHGAGDHDRRQPDAAAAVDGNPLSRQHSAPIDDRPKRRDEAAAEACCGGVVQLLRQPHEVGVGKVERHIFGERAPRREARLELVLADLVIARIAFVAMPAAGGERHGDAVARAPLRDLASDRHDRSRQFMARAHAAT